jgi:hypothetical protein
VWTPRSGLKELHRGKRANHVSDRAEPRAFKRHGARKSVVRIYSLALRVKPGTPSKV